MQQMNHNVLYIVQEQITGIQQATLAWRVHRGMIMINQTAKHRIQIVKFIVGRGHICRLRTRRHVLTLATDIMLRLQRLHTVKHLCVLDAQKVK